MKKATLTDSVTGENHNLCVLVYEYGDPVTIGRNEDRSIRLVEKPKSQRFSSSRIHATISYNRETDTYSIIDNGSTRGTFVNDSPLEGSTDLKDGDTLDFGPWYGPMTYEEPKAA